VDAIVPWRWETTFDLQQGFSGVELPEIFQRTYLAADPAARAIGVNGPEFHFSFLFSFVFFL
jgi:hypothetical protein